MPKPRKQTAVQYLDLVINALVDGGYRLRSIAEKHAHERADICFSAWLADADPDDVAEFIYGVSDRFGKYTRPNRKAVRVKA